MRLVTCLLLLLTFPYLGISQETHSGERTFMGDAVCASCHQRIANHYLQTAHHLTSALASSNSLLGDFTAAGGNLKISDPAPIIDDPGVHYQMREENGSFFEEAFTGFEKNWKVQKERIDLVVGSGVRGQSFLYWQNDRLFELPVSFWVDGHQWINSPGYRNGPPIFDRQANPRCLECHFSNVKSVEADWSANRYIRSSVTPGITCEVCHGAGSEHVALRREWKATDKPITDEKIINTAKLTRDSQVELCTLCHGGASRPLLSPAFTYQPGTPLGSHLGRPAGESAAKPDVHADQVDLLERSRCYVNSPKMSCSTCHDVHETEKPAASYSSRCLTCHALSNCGVFKKLGSGIAQRCIDCHMPVQQTNAIVSQTGDKVLRTSMRTHWIKIYPAAE